MGFQEGDSVRKQAKVAAEFVHNYSHQPPALGSGEEVYGADYLREHSASVDICHEHHGGIRQLNDRPVDDISVPQVHLGSAAGSLDHNGLVGAGKAFITGAHNSKEFLGSGKIASRGISPPDCSLNNDL